MVPGIPLLATGAFGTQWATNDLLFYIFAIMGGIGGMISLGAILALVGELVNRLRFRETVEGEDALAREVEFSGEPGSARRVRRSRATRRPGRDSRPGGRTPAKLDARGRAMQETALTIKPLSNFIYRRHAGGRAADRGRHDPGRRSGRLFLAAFRRSGPEECRALITLLVYLVPLHGRFAQAG